MPFKDNKREGGNETTWMPRNFIARRGDDGADKASESEIYKGAQTF